MNSREKEQEADRIDCELDLLARKARRLYEADGDRRWQETYMKIDTARGAVRQLMSEKDRAATMG